MGGGTQGGTPSRVPLWPDLMGGLPKVEYPQPGLMGVYPRWGTPPARSDRGYLRRGTPQPGFTGGYPRWGTLAGYPLARSDRGGYPRWGTPQLNLA